MGAIKDVVDLAMQLSEKVKDRKFASDLFQIIQLINNVQAEQVGLTEKNVQLITENADLKSTISTPQSKIDELQRQISELQQPSHEKTPTLEKATTAVLKLFFDSAQNMSQEVVASQLELERSIVAYHFDILIEKNYIRQATYAVAGSSILAAGGHNDGSRPATYAITPEGRKYIIEKNIT